MNVTIIGTGNMARAIARTMLAGKNHVTLLGRAADKGAAIADQLAPFVTKDATITVAELGGPIPDGVVISALWYRTAEDILRQYASQLKGKILVDISNPLNSTYDDLDTPPGSSAAEELAKIAPGVKVVKAFNTTFAGLLLQGHVAQQPLDVLIAGDDEQAKATVARLVETAGQRPIDVGPLRRARQLEGLGLLLIAMQGKHPKPWMNTVKFVG